MSLKIVQEGLAKIPLSVPMSVSSLNPKSQSFIEGMEGGGGVVHGVLFYLHNSRESIVRWQPLSLKTYHVGVQTPK